MAGVEWDAWNEGRRIVSSSKAPRPGKTILTKGLTTSAEAVRRFRELLKRGNVRPMVRQSERWGRIQIDFRQVAGNPYGDVALILWQFYFSDRGWQRLKRCDNCGKWFADGGKNKMGRFCEECRVGTKWWTWKRRREAGHGTGKRKAKRRRVR